MILMYQLKLSFDDLNKIKLSTMIKMADEIDILYNSKEQKVIGNPNDFKI